ncbi:MAG: hypothetical protein PVF58_01040 [Candidatus Methanofastidiosia archaeon]|jgi:hypothetical protein
MSSEAVTIPKKEYGELIETLEVLTDQDLLKRIHVSLQQFSQGEGITLEEVKKKFLKVEMIFSIFFSLIHIDTKD